PSIPCSHLVPLFCLHCSRDPRDLHSFPTRRSSDLLRLPAPHFHLGVGSGSHAEQTARVMVAYEELLRQQRPDYVVVVGDVNSTIDRKSTRLNSSHVKISYAVFCLKKKKQHSLHQ